jgi:glyoxylase-like metal-dependent hydrolase (beta-lactamase superfamily II)
MKPFTILTDTPPGGTLLGVCFPLGPLEANCYVLWDPGSLEAVVVDPGEASERLQAWLAAEKLIVKKIINTHGHVDHIGGNAFVKNITGAPLAVHRADWPMLRNPLRNLSAAMGRALFSPQADEALAEAAPVPLGRACLQVLETPGHSPGSVCLRVGNALFSGDTLFAGSVGRTDLPGSSHRHLLESLARLKTLGPGDLKVFPGHGAVTSLTFEKQYNPYLAEDPNHV